MPEILLDSAGGLVLILVLGLATSRLTSLLVEDAIFEPVRHEIFLISPPEDDPDRGLLYSTLARVPWRKRKRVGASALPLGPYSTFRDPGFIGRVVSCVYCTGVWVAAFLIGFWAVAAFPATLLILVLAVAQVHEVVHSWARL